VHGLEWRSGDATATVIDVRTYRRRGQRADAHHPKVFLVDSPEPSVDDLLERVARGDRIAFEDLYDTMAPRVLGLARRVVRDPAQAEEVMQEVLVEVWRAAARFDAERGSAVSWIMTITHRRAVDRVRSAQAATDREDTVASREVARPFDEVSEAVEARLEQEQVRRALTGLTDLQREAVTLAYYGGYTYREVAVLLDVPLGTVKTRLRDGLIRLRDALGVQL
jgi:RNA polymerase sigma-70 factor (ECF subfamily)